MIRTQTRLAMGWHVQQTGAMLVLCGVAIVALGWTQTHRLAWPAGATDPTAIAMGREHIDPNTASAGSLQRLPGIGPALTNSIIAYRDGVPAPAFSTIEDITLIQGIAEKRALRIEPYLQFPVTHAEPTP